DAEGAVAVRAKCLHGVRIEDSTVAAAGQRQSGNDFAIDRAKNDTSGRAAPSAATHREKNVVLVVERQACGSITFFTKVEMVGHLEGFCLHHGDVVRVGDVKVEVSLAVRSTLLDGGIGAVGADGLHLANNGTILRVDDEDVGRAVTQNEKMVSRGVENVAVRTRRGNGLDHLECFPVEKSRGI